MDAPFSPARQDGVPSAEQAIERLVREARDGSKSALGRALEENRKYLLLVANRALDDKLRSKVGASDLVQDTFVEAHRGFEAFRGNTPQEFYAWLVGILRHRVANSVRRYSQVKRRDVGREQPLALLEGALERLKDDALTPGTSFLARDEQRRVRAVLERLEEPWRSVLMERTWQGAAFAEIGARRNCSADAARKTWARAVRKLQELLTDIE